MAVQVGSGKIGGATTARTLSEGDAMGTAGLIDEQPSTVTVVAAKIVVVVVVEAESPATKLVDMCQ